MSPIPGVHFVQADFREDEGLKRLESALDGHKLDLVVSDLSPNLSGVEAAIRRDRCISASSLWNFPCSGCNRGAISSSKRSRAKASSRCGRAMEQHFAKVYVRKPQASRDRSREVYLVAKGLRS
jgi:23S rRNA (uridine2552-2'-O)-methyltransferase